MQESALRIFSSVPGILGNQINKRLIRQMLVKYLNPSSDPEVRFQVLSVARVLMFSAVSIDEQDDQHNN